MQISDLLKPEWVQIWLPLTVGGLFYWMFKIERNTSKTATSNEFIKAALNSLTAENSQAHEKIHDRIDREKEILHGRISEVDAKVDGHAIAITRLEENRSGR